VQVAQPGPLGREPGNAHRRSRIFPKMLPRVAISPCHYAVSL
jgi:hypothetical protein